MEEHELRNTHCFKLEHSDGNSVLVAEVKAKYLDEPVVNRTAIALLLKRAASDIINLPDESVITAAKLDVDFIYDKVTLTIELY